MFLKQLGGGGTVSGSPGEQGREGHGRREKKGREAVENFVICYYCFVICYKLSLFVTAYHPIKETNPITFLDFHLTFYEA